MPVPLDSSSKFQFVFVSDIARALHLITSDERAYNEIYNLSAPEIIDYNSFIKMLEVCNGGSFETKSVTVSEVLAENVPLPFPLDIDELYSGQKFAETFGFEYTPFSEGLQKAFNAFRSVLSV